MTQIITIQDDECWRCGKAFEKKVVKTSHHAIPKNLKPKKNICVPICDDCHEEINKQDINSLRGLTYKLLKTSQGIPEAVKILMEKLNNLSKKGVVLESSRAGKTEQGDKT